MTREDWMQNFGETLCDILITKNINQRELSDLSGIPTSTLNNYISGKSMVSGEAIVRIVYALDEIKEGGNIDYFDLLDFGDTIE